MVTFVKLIELVDNTTNKMETLFTRYLIAFTFMVYAAVESVMAVQLRLQRAPELVRPVALHPQESKTVTKLNGLIKTYTAQMRDANDKKDRAECEMHDAKWRMSSNWDDASSMFEPGLVSIKGVLEEAMTPLDGEPDATPEWRAKQEAYMMALSGYADSDMDVMRRASRIASLESKRFAMLKSAVDKLTDSKSQVIGQKRGAGASGGFSIGFDFDYDSDTGVTPNPKRRKFRTTFDSVQNFKDALDVRLVELEAKSKEVMDDVGAYAHDQTDFEEVSGLLGNCEEFVPENRRRFFDMGGASSPSASSSLRSDSASASTASDSEEY